MNDVETAEDVIFQTRATDNVVLNQPLKELKDKVGFLLIITGV